MSNAEAGVRMDRMIPPKVAQKRAVNATELVTCIVITLFEFFCSELFDLPDGPLGRIEGFRLRLSAGANAAITHRDRISILGRFPEFRRAAFYALKSADRFGRGCWRWRYRGVRNRNGQRSGGFARSRNGGNLRFDDRLRF